jgi:hypothetical protein
MSNETHNPSDAEPRAERLICRRLDGELSSEEAAELDAILASDPAARSLLAEYVELDLQAAEALRRDLAGTRPAVARRSHRGFWIGAASATLTAAAVVLLSFLLPSSDGGVDRITGSRPFSPSQRSVPAIAPSRFVDYRDVDLSPQRRIGNVHRDVIGIRSQNPNVIYIFERQRQSSRVVPVSGDF